MIDRLDSLASIESAIWQQLVRACTDKSHAWRTPVLATVKGDMADARTVVLREVDPRRRQLLIFTDARAGKVTQLLHKPRGTLVMWSRELGWQLRCQVHLSLEMAGLSASSIWARIKPTPAAQDYLAPLPPGTALTQVEPPVPATAARDYFAVIDATVEAVDWLDLHAAGHRRAIFDNQGPRWVQP